MQQYIQSLILTCGVLCACITGLFAQNNTVPVHLRLMARHYGDSVVLRWAFSEPEAWRYLNQRGYIVERFELDHATNQPIENGARRLSDLPIQPWTEAQFLQKATPRDTFVMVVGQCLYGKDPLPAGAEQDLFRTLELQAQSEENRLLFAMLTADRSPAAAQALGLRWVDRDLKKGRKYIYRLRVEDDPTDRFRTDTSLYVVATDQMFETPAPAAPEAIPGDSLVTLSWERSTAFTAYYIERSADQGNTWIRRNKDPYLNLVSPASSEPNQVYYSDPVPANYVKYLYRLRGTTLFGDVTAPSEPVEAMGVDLTPTAAPVIGSAEHKEGSRVELKWDIAPVKDLKGFRVCRSETVEGPWEPLHDGVLPPSSREFTDERADEFGTNYYRIYSIDEHDNAAGCFPMYVKMNNAAPPALPEWVNGTIDTTGKVTLHWKRGAERDLWGYQIYYNHQRDHEFIVLTSDVVADTTYSFQIPLDNLSEKIYFRLRAVDRGYMLSEYSAVLELHKPDKVAPTTPVFSDFLAAQDGIHLSWAPSSSKDVVRYRLERRQKGGDWALLTELGADARKYVDAAVKPGQRYQYALLAVDDSGLLSERSFGLAVQALVVHHRPSVTQLEAVVLPEKAGVELKWAYESQDSAFYFQVYDVLSNGSLRLLGTVDNPARRFVDTRPARERSAQYGVRAYHRDGGSSPVVKTKLNN